MTRFIELERVTTVTYFIINVCLCICMWTGSRGGGCVWDEGQRTN